MSDLAADIIGRIETVLGSTQQFTALHEPEFRGEEWAYVKDCLDSGWVSSVGAYVDRFEQDLARVFGTAHAVCVMNGTAALHLSLILAGVQRGDEVLVPALTFVATANAVSYAGAVPHLVDSDADSLGFSPTALAAWLDEIAELRDDGCYNTQTGRRIAAMMPMHVFGHAVHMDALLALASRWHIPVIEDAAEALGSRYKDRPLGSFGQIAAVSFNGNKILTTGGGGAILTNDPDLARKAKHLSTTAKMPHAWDFVHDAIGYNYRMPNLNAALGCAQLEQLPDRLAQKRRLAGAYRDAFADCSGAGFVDAIEECESNYWLNAVLLDKDQIPERDQVLAALNDHGLMARPVWALMQDLPMYQDVPAMPLPVAGDLAARLINIPSSACLATRIDA